MTTLSWRSPQSGERFEGVENFREWRREYAADLTFHLRRINHRDELVVTEYLISYNGAPGMFTVSSWGSIALGTGPGQASV